MTRIIGSVLSLLIVLAPASAQEASSLDKAPSRFVSFDKQRVHYKVLDNGLDRQTPALVLVHGWCGDISCWRFQVAAFEGKVRLVLIDLPGHGKSDKPEVDYTMDLFARAIDAVLTDAGVDRAVLAGFSMGTPVIRQFYRLYPKKVASLVLVDGSVRPFAFPPEQAEMFVKQFAGPDFPEAVAKFIDQMTANTPSEVRESIKKVARSTPQHVAVSAMKSMFLDPTIWKEDPIGVPVLAAMNDSPHWKGYEEFVRKLAPKTDYRVLAGAGHFVMMERPKEFNDHLAGFLKKQGLLK